MLNIKISYGKVTVEDCIEKVPNRFELVLLAARRAREISAGASLTVPRNNDKNLIIALREISEETLSLKNLREGIKRTCKKVFSWKIMTLKSKKAICKKLMLQKMTKEFSSYISDEKDHDSDAEDDLDDEELEEDD